MFLPVSTSYTRFLSPSSRSKNVLSKTFSVEDVAGTFNDALKRSFDFRQFEMAQENTLQDRFDSQWLNVYPSKNLGLKLSTQQVRMAIGLRLVSKIFERLNYVCRNHDTKEGNYGFSYLKSARRLRRY